MSTKILSSTTILDGCRVAEDAIKRGASFPRYVFSQTWDDFYFFDPDWMFDPDFVEDIASLLHAEGASSACMVNFGEAQAEMRLFTINAQTTAEDYRRRLQGSSPSDGWAISIDSFCCASTGRRWCFYCERENEMAVLATQKEFTSLCHSIIRKFGARRISEALSTPVSQGLTDGALTPQWRKFLLREYSR